MTNHALKTKTIKHIHTQQTYQRAMLFQFFDCNCPTVITMLWIIKNNNTCIVSKRTVIFLKVTIEFILQYLSWKEYVETVLFPMLYARTTHYTGHRWMWALDQKELTVLDYDKSLPINNIMIQMKLQTIVLSGKKAKKKRNVNLHLCTFLKNHQCKW